MNEPTIKEMASGRADVSLPGSHLCVDKGVGMVETVDELTEALRSKLEEKPAGVDYDGALARAIDGSWRDRYDEDADRIRSHARHELDEQVETLRPLLKKIDERMRLRSIHAHLVDKYNLRFAGAAHFAADLAQHLADRIKRLDSEIDSSMESGETARTLARIRVLQGVGADAPGTAG